MSAWTLINTTTPATGDLSTWGATSVSRRSSSQGSDECSVSLTVAKCDEFTGIASGDRVRLERDGVPWFSGIITSLSHDAGPDSETIELTIGGPWYFLSEFEMQQRWKKKNETTGVHEWVYEPHLIYNLVSGYGNPAATATMIIASTKTFLEEILNYVLAQCVEQSIAAPFQVGSILPGSDLLVPVSEADHVTCAQAIRNQLRWHPGAVCWADHSTTPPTINILEPTTPSGSVFTATILSPADDPSLFDYPLSGFEVSPANELVRENVVVIYHITGTIDEREYQANIYDAWPLTPIASTGREMSALCASIDLAGGSVSYTRGSIISAGFDATTSPDDVEWWKGRLPELTADGVGSVAMTGESRVEVCTDEELQTWEVDSTLDGYELVSGQIAEWMVDDFGNAPIEQIVRVTAMVSMEITDDGEVSSKLSNKLVKHQFTFTNLGTGDYTLRNKDVYGDPQPPISSEAPDDVTGVARHLYNWYNKLRYRGSITITKEEVPQGIDVGMLLNIVGGKPEWATMNALIQSVSWNVGQGTVTVRFGPPEHLGANDMVDHLRTFRDRRRWTNAFMQQGAEL